MSFWEDARRGVDDRESDAFECVLAGSHDGAIYQRKVSASGPPSGAVEPSSSSSPSPANGETRTPNDAASSETLNAEGLSNLPDRGRPLLRSSLFGSASRRVASPSPKPQRRGRTFSTMNLNDTGDEQDFSDSGGSLARDSSSLAHTALEPRPLRRSVALAGSQSSLACELSSLCAGNPHSVGTWPLESSEDGSETSTNSLPEDDDLQVRPLVQGYRDTFAIHNRRPNPSLHPPPLTSPAGRDLTLFLKRLALFIDHRTYLALRLTSRQWKKGITNARPLLIPAAHRLPTEIIQEIYGYLSPLAFNSARHTCHTWMKASMNNTLLQTMLQKGGWWSAAEARVTALIETQPSMPPLSTILRALHSQLALECALSATWTGNGVTEDKIPQKQTGRSEAQNHSTSRDARAHAIAIESAFAIGNARSPYSLVSIIDFSEFGELHPFHLRSYSDSSDSETQYDSRVRLSASKCGRFLLICDNHRVFVYELGQDAAVRLVTCISCPGKVLNVSMDTSCGRYAVAMLLHGRAGLVAQIAGHRQIFRDVCTEEDPPLSVAISPQRSFVAFGSATGIEVHWMESHRNVSRWFPLTVPSNHLYFLPSRKKHPDPEHIRLVSSAAISSMTKGCEERESRRPADTQGWSSEYLYGRWISRARDGHDSYYAIPLSDGEHVLFTDPHTQSLCLGGDVPVRGSMEKERRVILKGPRPDPGAGVGPENIAPSVYSAGGDLTTGVRILAGYGDELWFFSVPIDIFLCEDSGLNECWSATYQSCSLQTDMAVRREKRGIWPLILSGQRLGTVPRLVDVAVDSRPDSLSLWALSASGIIKVWQIRDRPLSRVPRVVVNRCGNIALSTCLTPREETADQASVSPTFHGSHSGRTSTEPFPEYDLEGDVIMHDAPPLASAHSVVEDLDGSTSPPRSATAPLMLCEIHDGGGAVCRGWMAPRGDVCGMVLQWQGTEWSAEVEGGRGL